MKNAFKVGDTVRLKSGGPNMRVSNPRTLGDDVRCQWFAGSKMGRDDFPPGALVQVWDEGELAWRRPLGDVGA